MPKKPMPHKPEVQKPWFKRSSNEIGEALISFASQIKQNQIGIETRNWRSALLYGGQGYMSTGRFSPSIITGGATGIGGIGGQPLGAYASPRFNLIYSGVSTVHARLIAPGIPAVDILPNEADFRLSSIKRNY